ncbi:ABC transporter ATP-binding protein [Janthinobacterium agaricidamnosum]|uniref:ABC transporter family protein n=1 Tax=Janthinobacterium agaricidamnosum NBRC 102515 = DSM 9628 TaxID=1349767 RepID=W0V9C2_9BURK|nr:ABC transporter ATP-binding protein [Janthinobacterium agaricidamnosum]CDG84456.1 ABC transporter family protein [Janthinobacterium agaricidamnosum NBRC 102515 = DSM 9628]
MSLLLEVNQLDVRFGAHHAVRGLDFSIAAGETLALVGESGCGKSSTALALMRLLPASARVKGQVLFEGQDLVTLPPPALRALRGNAISMIFQEPMTSLNPVLTIGRQIVEVLRLHQPLSAGAARRRAIELLELVKLPEPRRRIDDYPHQLSGGQRQRVMIAMAVACHPRLLIADEPTTALDVTIQAQILELLDALRREFSMALLLITHDLGVVGQWADRVAVMYGGEKLEQGTTGQIFTRPQHSYTRGLLGASLTLERNLHYRQQRLLEVSASIDPLSGQRRFILSHGSQPPARQAQTELRLASSGTEEPASAGQPLLRLTGLATHYASEQGLVRAVDGVSFDIAAGETVGLVGESGCGKSTLGKTILRLIEPSAGQILFRGADITRLSQRQLQPFRRQAQMIFQDPYASLNPRHSVADILDSALRVHGVGDRAERQRRASGIIDRVGLPAAALRRFAHEFSGGQRQRIGIARALVLQPSLLICDEPVSALDVSVQAQILNLLVDLKQEFGLSYLFISHDLSVLRYIADRVLVMNGGKIVESGDHRSIWHTPVNPYTRSLIGAVPTSAFAAGIGQRQPPPVHEQTLPFSYYRFAL